MCEPRFQDRQIKNQPKIKIERTIGVLWLTEHYCFCLTLLSLRLKLFTAEIAEKALSTQRNSHFIFIPFLPFISLQEINDRIIGGEQCK